MKCALRTATQAFVYPKPSNTSKQLYAGNEIKQNELCWAKNLRREPVVTRSAQVPTVNHGYHRLASFRLSRHMDSVSHRIRDMFPQGICLYICHA